MIPDLAPFLLRMKLQAQVRRALEARGYQEVTTPVLQEAPGSDPEIEPMTTEYFPLMQPDQSRTLFLHTSPEFAMKRLLCRGLRAIYQIAPVFRQGEHGPQHSPEFTMAEWYRVGWTWQELMAEVEEIVREILGPEIHFQGQSLKLRLPLARVSVAEAFREVGLDLADWDHLPELAWLDKYFRAFVEKVMPWLAKQGPLFLTDFPAPLAIMSRLQPDNPNFAERFELMIAGVELANGATELTDPHEHRRRFLNDQQIRELTKRKPHPLPESFLHDLETFGLPPCAGVALGMERLAMIATGSTLLAPLLPFPFGK